MDGPGGTVCSNMDGTGATVCSNKHIDGPTDPVISSFMA